MNMMIEHASRREPAPPRSRGAPQAEFQRLLLGDALVAVGRNLALTDDDVAAPVECCVSWLSAHKGMSARLGNSQDEQACSDCGAGAEAPM